MMVMTKLGYTPIKIISDAKMNMGINPLIGDSFFSTL
jgi:hypothetical protein